MTFSKFLTERFDVELDYYEENAKKNKLRFQISQVITIIFSVVTPVLLALNIDLFRGVAIISSGIVTLATSILAAFKFQENWINYRTVAESLKKEKSYFDAKICDYENANDPEKLFVSNVENLISRENTIWLTCQKSTIKNKPLSS